MYARYQHAGVAHECREAADALRQIALVEPAVAIALLATSGIA